MVALFIVIALLVFPKGSIEREEKCDGEFIFLDLIEGGRKCYMKCEKQSDCLTYGTTGNTCALVTPYDEDLSRTEKVCTEIIEDKIIGEG